MKVLSFCNGRAQASLAILMGSLAPQRGALRIKTPPLNSFTQRASPQADSFLFTQSRAGSFRSLNPFLDFFIKKKNS